MRTACAEHQCAKRGRIKRAGFPQTGTSLQLKELASDSGPDPVGDLGTNERARMSDGGVAETEPGARELLGARLRELIRLAGVTQKQAAQAANERRRPPGVDITDKRISDWVNGKHVPAEPELTHLVNSLIAAVRRRQQRHGLSLQELGPFHSGLLQPHHWLAWREAARKQGSLHDADTAQRPGPVDRPRRLPAWSAQRLGVHPAISATPGEARDQDFVLPQYVARAHDALIQAHLRAAALPSAAPLLVAVVGESCTGKTRTAFEAMRAVVPDSFELLFPTDAAGLAALLDADAPAPGTVLWLNEAQVYLAGPLGERVSAALLRRLDSGGPLIVIATLWPNHHQSLTAAPQTNSTDPHHLARQLLAQARLISVPDTFADDLPAARRMGEQDRSLATAVRLGSAVTQTLAAGPDLVRHYELPSGSAGRLGRALIEAAMDARRLGVGGPLPLAFLREAAPGYLPDPERARAGTGWFTDALTYSRMLIKQIAVPLPDVPQPTGMGALPGVVGLADFLQHHGRLTRRAMCPPASFWQAALTYLEQGDELFQLGIAARLRHRLEWAQRLYQRAADAGSVPALSHLADWAENSRTAEQLLRQAIEAGDPNALLRLGILREDAHDLAGAEDLYRQAIASGDAAGHTFLAALHERAGDLKEAESLYRQAVRHGAIGGLGSLARLHENRGRHEAAARLYRKAIDAGATSNLIFLARLHKQTGHHEAAEACYQEAIDAGIGDDLLHLAEMFHRLGHPDYADEVIERAARAGVLGALVVTTHPHDETTSRSLYRKALATGDATALSLLGKIQEKLGDPDRTEHLYILAANCGSQQRQFYKRWPNGLDPDGTPTSAL
ncbi:sel1 repeat family protein [Streptomyces sp. NBC_01334]|uniref:sel1 repeat family protein n=1 Tax=Streptomyces sp. NBC_01334 TaxID=2903827 RepID=UPI002E10480F|nr:sel1 repeat family protein [Streptomyces sp. NBC_01334]